MGKRLSIEAYLTVEELEQRYRAARDAVARSQWQIIWLLGGGATSQEVAAVTGYSVDVSAGLCLPADRSDALVAAPHHQPAGV